MHDHMPKFMGERSAHPVGGHVAIQKDAWWQVANLHSHAVDPLFQLAPNHKNAGAFAIVGKVRNGTFWN